MRFRVVLFLAIGIWFVSAGFGAPADPPLSGTWHAVFEDEFEGSALDNTKWKLVEHWGNMNSGAQPHPDNMAVVDGALKITWDKKSAPFTFGGKTVSYASGEVSTYKRFHQKYGYFECRMKYDVHRGCWPAFWTMPVVSANSDSANIKMFYLKIDLTGRPVAAVTNASLKLKLKSADAGYYFDIYRVAGDTWSEGALTWNSRPKFDAIFMAQVKPAAVAGGWVSVDVTKFVNQQLTGDKIVSLALADIYQQGRQMVFYSSEAAVTANRPYLDLDGTAVTVSEDGYVNRASPAAGFGTDSLLSIYESWGYNVDTYTPGMEIDIHEALGIWGPNKTSHAWHWNGYGADHLSGGFQTLNTPDQNSYCTFGLNWTEGKLDFYVDRQLVHTHTGNEVCAVPSFMILSGQIGGWDGNGDNLPVNFDPFLPLNMYVDYVKVWASGPGTGTSGPAYKQNSSGPVSISCLRGNVIVVTAPYLTGYELRILRCDGKTVRTMPSNNNGIFTFNRQEIKNGLYMIRVITDKETVSKRMMLF